MPAIKIQCPKCQRTYKIEEKILGKKVTCATEGCGTKFIAELPAASDSAAEADVLSESAAATEPPQPTSVAVASAPPPAPVAPEPTPSDDPFADLDLDSLHSLPPRRSSSRNANDFGEDEIDSAPPPLPIRRTTPPVPGIDEEESEALSTLISKLVLAALCVAIVGVSGWIAFNHFSPPRSSRSAVSIAATDSPPTDDNRAVETGQQKEPPPLPIVREQFIELMALTDLTLRLMRVSNNPALGRSSIEEYQTLRNTFQSSSKEMAIHLESIEVLLRKIHYHLHRDDPKHYLVSDPTNWQGAANKVREIRNQQSALLELARVPWKDTQVVERFKPTFAELCDAAHKILKDGAVVKDDYPAELDVDDALQMKTNVNTLFARVPVPLNVLTEDSEFTVPEDIELSEQTSDASQIHRHASQILEHRALMLRPSFRDRFNRSPAERKTIELYHKSMRALEKLLN